MCGVGRLDRKAMFFTAVLALTSRRQHRLPSVSVRLELLTVGNRQWNRDVGKMLVPIPHNHVCAPRHGSMHRVLA